MTDPKTIVTITLLSLIAINCESDFILGSADGVKTVDLHRGPEDESPHEEHRDTQSEVGDNDETKTTTEQTLEGTDETIEPIENATEFIENLNTAKDNVSEDNYSNEAGYITQVEPIMTTYDPDAPSPTMAGLAEVETTGQRSPKTDNSDIKPPDAWSYEKPKSVPTLSKSSTLRSWLEDAWLRPPAGILVPLRPAALSRALAVWNDLTAGGLNLTDIVIVGYDSNGVNWRSRHNLQPSGTDGADKTVSEALSKLLRKYQGVYPASNDGTMRALASAAKLVPYDSALFLITDQEPGDPQRLPLALRALVEKRLKVYTIWTSPNYPSKESETALQDLRNVSAHTEGEVLPYSMEITGPDKSDRLAELQQWEPMEIQRRQARMKSFVKEDDLDTILVRRGGGEAISLGVPVENGVTALKIIIEGAVEHAVLYPPNDGNQIDLYNASSVRAFSNNSRSDGSTRREIYLAFPGSDPDKLSVLPATPPEPETSELVGMWHLSVRCDTCNYRLRIAARTMLHFNLDVGRDDTLIMKVTGPVSRIRDAAIIDEYGSELAKLPFSYQPTADLDHDPVGPVAVIETEVTVPTLSTTSFYVKIIGRDMKGEAFIRVTGPILQEREVRMGRSAVVFPESPNDLERAEELDSVMYNNRMQTNDTNTLPFGRSISQVLDQSGRVLTSVQIGLSSTLYGGLGDRLQIYFEVTNFRDRTVPFNFGAVGNLRFLTGIQPSSQSVLTGQTVTVIVSLLIPESAQPGARDLITFTAYGVEEVAVSVFVTALAAGQTLNDQNAPEVRHNFQGSCTFKLGDDCAEHTWSATVIARDSVAGLFRFTSTPSGLRYEGDFISGTRDEVTATYRSTCCSPRVLINAIDALGNTNSYIIDITNYLTPAAIAAIVLGVLLLIGLLALIIFLIYWCVKRRKEERDLPTYTSRNIT